jgi:hypothetical protein
MREHDPIRDMLEALAILTQIVIFALLVFAGFTIGCFFLG